MNNQRSCSRRVTLSLTLIFSFIVAWNSTSAFAQTPTAQEAGSGVCKPNRRAEKWVLMQVAAGYEADLGWVFPREADRVLSASFLEHLLTTSLRSAKVHRNGVHIAHARVCEAVDLRNAEVPFDTSLNDCYFKDEVSLNQSRFRKSLMMENTIFAGSFDCGSAEITMTFDGNGAQFKREANFNSIKAGNVFFSKAIFEGSVDLALAEIDSTLDADDAQFKNRQQVASFQVEVVKLKLQERKFKLRK